MQAAAIGWVVSPFFDFVVAGLLEKLKKPLKRTYGIEADIEKLQQILPEIQSVVSVAETLKVANRFQADLLRQMKEAVYDAEDVVDEFNYRLLEAEAAKEDSVAEKFGAKVLTTGKRLVGADPLQRSLSKAIESLEGVNKTADAFIRACNIEKAADQEAGQSSRVQQAHMASRARTSIEHEKIFVGRDADIKNIIVKIKEQADCSSAHPLVILVVGVGGIGKTTLAQKVYNHEEIASNVFEMKMWVNVANTFDHDMVTGQILANIKGKKIDCDSLNTVQNEISEELGSKKFLLILDDVWVEDENEVGNRETWKMFLSSFDKCKGGSSIMVTTRLTSVVKMIDDCTQMEVYLKGLSSKDSNDLFKSHAFRGCNSGATHCKKLEAIGEKIVDKLFGLPLAIKLIGMHLSSKRSVKYWDDVLINTVSAAGDVIKILKLSYDYLPPHLKPCFGYCSLFPKGYRFTENGINQLIHMWIAQGFIHNKDGSDGSLEDIGRSYFDNLCSRSFFQRRGDWYTEDIGLYPRYFSQLTKPDWYMPTSYYVMHDLINDLAQFVSKEECWQIQSHQSNSPSTRLRHVSVSSIDLHVLSKKIRLDKLRTLLVLNRSKEHVCTQMEDVILASLKGARVLDLSGCCIEKLPETIEQMIHLRYLAFDSTSTLLPETCSRLFNLQVVCMTGYRREIRGGIICKKGLDGCAPKNMSSLNNLSHVYVPNRYLVEITGHWKIPQFHGNAVFTLNLDNKLEDIHDIGFQGNLAIQKLENAGSKHDDLKPVICQNELMKELKLEWSSSALVSSNNDNDVLEVLLPPSNLPSLEVHGYRGSQCPFWLKNNYLTNLSSLHLRNCSELRELPPLGQLPRLEKLELSALNAVEEISPEFYGTKDKFGFPSLELLKLTQMQNLVEWSIPEFKFRPLFPLLKEVIITECNKLRRVPNIFPVTKGYKRLCIDGYKFNFAFVSCAPTSSSGGHDTVEKIRQISQRKRLLLRNNPYLFWKVTDFSGFKFLSRDINSLFKVQTLKLEMLDFHSHPEVVKDLYLFNCTQLLSEVGFTKLSSLERLTIEDDNAEDDDAEEEDDDGEEEDDDAQEEDDDGEEEDDDAQEEDDLTEEIKIDLRWLTSLTELRIKDCKNLMGINGLEALTCLTMMEIMGNRHLSETITQYEFLKPFSSLSTLKISDLDFGYFEGVTLDLQHSRGLKVLHITYCTGKLKLINCNSLTFLTELVIDKCPSLIIDPADIIFLKSLHNLNLKLNGWAPPLLYDGSLSCTTECGNEVQEAECKDKAESRNYDCSIDEIAKGKGYPLLSSCQPSTPEKQRTSDASVLHMREERFKDVKHDRLGPGGLSLHEWIVAHGTSGRTLEFQPPLVLFGRDNKIVITPDDINDLMEVNWLNVSVIQLYMMKLYNICAKENIQNISFLDPARINATQFSTEKHVAVTYMAETKQSQQTILAPYFENHHWLLLVIKPSEGTVYVLDSLNNTTDRNYIIKDAITQAFSPNMRWIIHPSPQQNSGLECGYYVMILMQDIITRYREFPKGSLPQNYTDPEIDSVRRSWIKFFLESSQAKAFRSAYLQSPELPIAAKEPEEEDGNEVQEAECQDEAKNRNNGPQVAEQKMEIEEHEVIQNKEFRREMEQATCESLPDNIIFESDDAFVFDDPVFACIIF